jgi:hypothetical protein
MKVSKQRRDIVPSPSCSCIDKIEIFFHFTSIMNMFQYGVLANGPRITRRRLWQWGRP